MGNMNDPVNHPSHYTAGKIEVIDFLEDQNLDFRLSNVIKYICRAGKKNPDTKEEDLRKAQWYLNRYLDKEFPALNIGPDGTLKYWKGWPR